MGVYPSECPVEVECSQCGKERSVESSYGWTYSDDGEKIDGTPTYHMPTSSRKMYRVFCPCGRLLETVLNPRR